MACDICGKIDKCKKVYILNKERKVCDSCVSFLKTNKDDSVADFYLENWENCSISLKADLLRTDSFLKHRKQHASVYCEGHWEYKVLNVINQDGFVNTDDLSIVLNDLALDGWRVVSAHSNELGVNAIAIMGFAVNSTAEQNIVILERYVK